MMSLRPGSPFFFGISPSVFIVSAKSRSYAEAMNAEGRRLDIATTAVLVFASAKTAEHLVAGIPAAARAAREVGLVDGPTRCVFAVAGGWTPSARCLSELRRLTPQLSWTVADPPNASGDTLYLRGAALPPAAAIASRADHPATVGGADHPAIVGGVAETAGWRHAESADLAELDRAGRAIVAATGKPGDGIVSRHINRPISHAISRLLLRLPGVEPVHATLGTLALGLAMAAALFLGGDTGLLWGALLFQAASIFDGVDGEIARATFRASDTGARLDSLTDMATNLAFVAGVTVNLGQQGHRLAAAASVASFLMLATGLLLIGLRTSAMGGPFTFDLIKHHVRRRDTRLTRWLTFLTMRDFIALACAVLILAGLGPHTLVGLALGVAVWLAVTLAVLFRTRTERPTQSTSP